MLLECEDRQQTERFWSRCQHHGISATPHSPHLDAQRTV